MFRQCEFRIYFAVLIFGGAFLAASSPALSQTSGADSTLPASYLCKEQVQRIGPQLDALLANTNPEENFRVSYQATVAANLIRSACSDVPQDNPYEIQTDELEISFQDELGTNTEQRCQAVGADLSKQLETVSADVTRSPERARNTVAALDRVIDLTRAVCPDNLAEAFGQLSSGADRLQDATRAWPACGESREAFSKTVEELSEKLQSPENDPSVLDAEVLTPALKDIKDACEFEAGWLAGVDESEAEIRSLMAARPDEVRQACQTGLLAIEESFNVIDARSAEFKAGCTDFDLFQYDLRDATRAIETVLNETCRLFPAATVKPNGRYARQMRLVDEFKAEDAVMQVRLEKEGEDILSCAP